MFWKPAEALLKRPFRDAVRPQSDNDATIEIPVDAAHRAFVMVVAGDGRVHSPAHSVPLGPTAVATMEAGEGSVLLDAGERGLQVLMGSGVPLDGPAYMHGGFCMSSREGIIEAIDRYERGELDGLISAP